VIVPTSSSLLRPSAALAVLALLAGLLVLAPATPARASAAGFVYSGMYTAGMEAPGNADTLTLAAEYDALAQWSGERQTFGGAFVGITDANATIHKMERAWRAQSTPVLNIELPGATAAQVARGDYDARLLAWAQGLRPWFDQGGGRSAIFAPLQEMNGDWTTWGCDPGSWKIAYRKIRDIVRHAGLDDTKVRWGFAPNGWHSPRCGPMAHYYPGGDVVDVVGFSAYNYGSKTWNRQPESPAQVFGPYLDQARQFAADKPFIIWQTGTSPEAGRDAWLRDAYAFLAADPNVVGVVYFNLDKSAWGGNEWDWRIWYGPGDGRNAGGLREAMSGPHTPHAWPLTDWFQAGQPVPLTPVVHASGPVERVAGPSRTATAAALSATTRPQAETVVLARSDAYPDALAGGPLAHALGAPMLLTPPAALDAVTREEIARLGARRAVILGGAAAVSPQVEAELAAAGLAVERIAGANRFETARLVAARVGGRGAAYLVEGLNADPGRGWPDAVAVGALAAHEGRPILLATRDSLPGPTAEALRDAGTGFVTIVGGQGAVSEDVAAAVASLGITVDRLAGRTRYETSHVVATRAVQAGMSPQRKWLATGRNFPDALAAASAVAADGGVLLLIDGQTLDASPGARDWLGREPAHSVVRLVGGQGAISTAVEQQVRRLTAR
jgi:putative cell wall-binding protein